MKFAELEIYLDKKFGNVIQSALIPEMTRDLSKSEVKISTTDTKIVINIRSEELSTLRATLNSYLRWINYMKTG